MLNMKITLQIKLIPDGTQHAALLDTMKVFNDACCFIAEVAHREKCVSKFALQKLTYHAVRAQFGLSAQMAILAVHKVVGAYRRDTSIQCSFKPDGAIAYDQRVLSFKGLEKASILTVEGRMTIPMQMGEYQKVQFGRAHGQADLVLRDGVFYLLLVVDTPAAPAIEPAGFIGVDLGIVRIASDSDGECFDGGPVEKTRARYHKQRQALQSCGSRSATRRLKKISKKESNFRRGM
ncbi:MAG: transposase [Candidatus Methylumidiphilus alinenensis]|uniref:Transposase n=1 Tax=Candidatus Methylumidiphilus alinenensis TaxID=2202197 RepID=A0A2W4RVY7_9GAMM|nr:MAG: transposase [Candidatus Methylumidiphilus alinenensis]